MRSPLEEDRNQAEQHLKHLQPKPGEELAFTRLSRIAKA
jgi:hypothetical protein